MTWIVPRHLPTVLVIAQGTPQAHLAPSEDQMNPYFTQAVAQSHQQDLMRAAQAARLGAGVGRPSRAARVVRTLCGSLRRGNGTAPAPAAARNLARA